MLVLAGRMKLIEGKIFSVFHVLSTLTITCSHQPAISTANCDNAGHVTLSRRSFHQLTVVRLRLTSAKAATCMAAL